MSFHDFTPQHRAGSGLVVYRTAVTTSVNDPASRSALQRANRRLWWRRLGYDLAIGALSALAVMLLTLIGLWAAAL